MYGDDFVILVSEGLKLNSILKKFPSKRNYSHLYQLTIFML